MVVYSIIVVAMTLLLLPRVAELVRDLGSWNRAYERQKKLLELQKLRYEVEVLRKTNGLNELSGLEILPNTSGRASGTAPASSAAADAKPDDRSSELVRLSWPMRWLYVR